MVANIDSTVWLLVVELFGKYYVWLFWEKLCQLGVVFVFSKIPCHF